MEHEKLESYQGLMRVAEDAARRVTTCPRGHGNLVDQLRRAMNSAALNVVEGNARRGRVERRRFFEISMGSIAEVAACLDLARANGLILDARARELKDELHRVSRMIWKLMNPG